jgi:polyhydroxybutyrate depolymerase
LPSSGTDQTSSPDVDFVTNVVDDAGSALCLDPSRQYASGFSMGSAMTLLLACQPDRRYAAFGGVGAAFYESACSQAPPAPLIYFHGTNDDVVPFEGGTARGFEVAPVPEVMASWATHNGCSTGPAETTTADVTLLGWSDCALNADVDFFRVAEGSHTWPGSPVTTNPVFADYAGVTTDTVNATDAMWEFFSGYQLPTQ